MENDNNLNDLKKEILTASYYVKEGHIASSFSILDILDVLYSKILNVSLDKVYDENRDRFVLSKGHAAIGLYAILKKYGFINIPLTEMCKHGSILGGHPDSLKVPGVEVSTGSLGHGLPSAVGMALGLKIKNSKARVFALVGDGEANEGTIWESFLVAAHNKLNNLCVIIDYNHSTDRAVELNNLYAKMDAFGMETVIINGHNHEEIEKALKIESEKPIVVIANTIKGYGIKEMVNNPAWHHRFPNAEEYERFMEELA